MSKCYISHNNFLYTVKRVLVPCGDPKFKIACWSARSGNWLELPGLPDFGAIALAEKRLDGLAKDNGWHLFKI